MISFRPLPIMTALAIAAFALLIALGRWQWEKYESKHAAAEAPVAEMTIAGFEPIADGMQFVFGVRPDTHEQGWRIFAPVLYGQSFVFVDAGFIAGDTPPNADEVRVPAALRSSAPITGASIRPDPPGRFTAPPTPARRLWFAVDLPSMAANAGLEPIADYYIAAAYVGADGRAAPNPFAYGGEALPPERHLGYALTWYGIALVLIGVYFAYHISAGRLRLAPPAQREG